MFGKRKIKLSTFLVFGAGGFILVFALYVALNISAVAESYIEEVFYKTTGVPVHIGKIVLRHEDSMILLRDVRIKNPPGFTERYAIVIPALDAFIVEATDKSLVVNKVDTLGTRILFEVKDQNQINLLVLQDKFDPYATAIHETQNKWPMMSLGQIAIKDGKLIGKLGNDKGIVGPVKLPVVEVRNLGTETGTILISQVLATVLEELIETAVTQAGVSGFMEALPAARQKEVLNLFNAVEPLQTEKTLSAEEEIPADMVLDIPEMEEESP